jgi:ubiquinone/menaquinone biosynthesis C-methylase UbiE
MSNSNSEEHKMEDIYFLEKQEVELREFEADGFILDIGGGGEGVIGQLMGERVIAIDPNLRELEDAAVGPVKIVMDAKDLKFLDDSFQTVTSFFTLMYINAQDQKLVFDEVFRVLKSDGKFLIWDIDLPARTDEVEEIVAFHVKVNLPIIEFQTGYGTRWPDKRMNLDHYLALAELTGYRVIAHSESGRVFILELQKP